MSGPTLCLGKLSGHLGKLDECFIGILFLYLQQVTFQNYCSCKVIYKGICKITLEIVKRIMQGIGLMLNVYYYR